MDQMSFVASGPVSTSAGTHLLVLEVGQQRAGVIEESVTRRACSDRWRDWLKSDVDRRRREDGQVGPQF